VLAWQLHQTGEPKNVLRFSDVPAPHPGAGQLRVSVRAAALNFADVLMCRGEYQIRPDLPFTPGLEVCGQVERVGTGVTGVMAGDRVIGSTVMPHGGFAEICLVQADRAFSPPAEFDDAESAALYIAYQTGWMGLHRRARLKAGETLLVHAAAGGVGSAAVQLGKAAGATVIGVAGGPRKAATARALGADIVIDHRREDFVAVVKDATGGRGADVIYDPVGGDVFRRSTKCIAFEGRILIVGFASGEIPSAALNHALVKNYSLVGLHWGLYTERDPERVRECHAALCDLAEVGAIRPVIGERLSLDGTADGLKRLADGTTIGRLVVTSGGVGA